MGRLFVFMGKSASGKDTLYREVMRQQKGLHPVIPYTTRPIRAEETEGEEYHFVTEEQMEDMKRAGQIVECRCYQTVKGPWYYFTAEDGQIDFQRGDFALISTLEGYEKLRVFYGADQVVPLYIEVGDVLRLERALAREKQQKNPCVAELCRRFLADEEDFSEDHLMRLGILRRISNISMDEAICQIEEALKNGR